MSLIVDAEGARRMNEDGTILERVAWADLVRVAVATSSEGPWVEDVYVLLIGHDEKGVAIPNALVNTTDLVARLFRLPGFDGAAFIRAQSSTDDAIFECWSGSRGAGVASGGD